MNLERLETFLWVARMRGVRRAAERMHLSQPAVSARLAALELELGARLFERGPRGMTLTPVGERLRHHAEKMLFLKEEIRREIVDPASEQGLFRVGCSETIAQTWLPALLADFSALYPRVSLDLVIDTTDDLARGLRGRRLDLALLMGPLSDAGIRNLPLPSFELCWFRRAGHSEPTDLAVTPVISYPQRTRPYQQLAQELLRRYGPGVRLYSSASLATSIGLIAAGVAVGAFPLRIAEDALQAGRIEIFDPGWLPDALDFCASWRSDPPSATAFAAAGLAAQAAQRWHAM